MLSLLSGTSYLEHWLLYLVSDGVLLLSLGTLLVAMLAIGIRMRHVARERRWQRLHALWDPNILSVLCGDATPEDFHLLVQSGQELDCIHFLAPYGYRLRGSDLGVLAKVAEPYLPLVAERLTHRSPGVRIWAINVLSLFGLDRHEQQIAERLEDPIVAVALFAAATLLSHHREHYLERVLKQLPRFEHWNRHALASLLSDLGPASVSLLEAIYADPKQPVRTRVIAAEALGLANAYQASHTALLLLGSETNQELLVATLELLGNVSQGVRLDAVRAICKSPNDVLRLHAMRTLRKLGMRADLPVFREALDDSNIWVARQAALALQELGDSATLDTRTRGDDARAALFRQVLASAL